MRRLSLLETVLIISLLLVCIAPAAVSAQTAFTITRLATLTGSSVGIGLSFNDSGQRHHVRRECLLLFYQRNGNITARGRDKTELP